VRAYVDFGVTVADRVAALRSVPVLSLDPGQKLLLAGGATSLGELAANGLSLRHQNYLVKLSKKLYDSVVRPTRGGTHRRYRRFPDERVQ